MGRRAAFGSVFSFGTDSTKKKENCSRFGEEEKVLDLCKTRLVLDKGTSKRGGQFVSVFGSQVEVVESSPFALGKIGMSDAVSREGACECSKKRAQSACLHEI